MSRPTRYKIGYLLALIVVSAIAVFVMSNLRGSTAALFAVVAVLVIPGRVQGVFYRDLFRGRRLLSGGHAAEAEAHFERFLALVRESPWRKWLIWLSWSVYTPDVEAMTLNNLGAARIQLGKRGEAATSLGEALEIDPQYPIPYFNLAILHELEGNRESAEQAATAAGCLGFSGGKIEQVVLAAQSVFARVEGHGTSST